MTLASSDLRPEQCRAAGERRRVGLRPVGHTLSIAARRDDVSGHGLGHRREERELRIVVVGPAGVDQRFGLGLAAQRLREIAEKDAGLHAPRPVPAGGDRNGRKVAIAFVAGHRRRLVAAQCLHQPDQRGVAVGRESRAGLVRELELRVRVGQHFGEGRSSRDTELNDVHASITHVGEVSLFESRLLHAPHLRECFRERGRPRHDVIGEHDQDPDSIAIEAGALDELARHVTELEGHPAIAETRRQGQRHVRVRDARLNAIAVLDAEVDHAKRSPIELVFVAERHGRQQRLENVHQRQPFRIRRHRQL